MRKTLYQVLLKMVMGTPTGVSVIVKHGKTTTGTVTDLNGHYQVKAEPNATIEFSFIGFKSVTVPANQKMINVTLHDDNQLLDEVVVVGYGTQKKVNLTGAVSQVTAEILETAPHLPLRKCCKELCQTSTFR